MIRIAENRCGYINGYTCSPIEPINDIFAETPIDIFRTPNPTDDDWVWTDSLIVDYGHTYTHQQECIDNYAQVPQSFEGFVLTMPEVADMSGGTYSRPFEVPEIACRTNMDPFVDGKSVQNASADYTAMSNALYDGLIDLYNNVYEYKDPATQAYVNPEPTVFDVLINHNASGVDKTQVTGTTSGRYYFRQTVQPAYNFTVGPGLLEPMLDTMFPPVSVDTITGPDALGDFTVWLFDEFNAWKGLIDDRLSNMHQAVAQFDYGSINGLLNLEAAKNMEGPCDNFTIVAGYTASPLFRTEDYRSGKYSILGGTIYVNGSTTGITVPALLYDIQAPFDAYLDYDITGNTASIAVSGVSVSFDRQQDHLYYYIGGVRLIRNNRAQVIDPGTDFSLYEIIQEECLSDIVIGGGTVAPTPCDPYEYDGPFQVVTGSTIGSIAVEGIDIIGEVPKAGLLWIDGMTHSWKDYGEVTSPVEGSTNRVIVNNIESGDDIYANIKTDGNVEYSLAIEGGTDYIANIRLAKVISHLTTYDVTLSGDTIYHTADMEDHIMSGLDDTDVLQAGWAIISGTTTGSEMILGIGDTAYAYEVVGNTCTGNYQLGGTVSVAAVDTNEINQIHYGDLYVYTQPEPIVGGTYSGPFHIIQDSDGLSFECIEWTDNNQRCASIGDLVINGYIRTPIGMTTISGSTASDSAYIYAHVTSPSAVTFDTDPAPSGTPPAYTVRLAKITGATTTETVVEGQTVYELHGGTIDILQYHHGDLYVDGRWS